MKEIVDRIFKTNPIYTRIKGQIRKGVEKYGTPVDPNHYSMKGWHEHVQQELVDALTYNEIELYKVEQVQHNVQAALNVKDPYEKDRFLRYALQIMEGGSDDA